MEDKTKTFENYDLLGLKDFSNNLKNHVIAEYPYVDGSLVISLNGKFGCGKTCFLQMFENYLKEEKFESIYINSWKNDFFDEAIITILSELIDYIKSKETKMGKVVKPLKDTLLNVVGATAVVSNQLSKKMAGIDFKEVSSELEKDSKDRDIQLGNKIFEEYSNKKKLFDEFNKALEEYVSENSKPLFILVDELDRTRPDYAVTFIETLKHFFKTQGVVFILAVDKEHLKSSVKSLYGSEINFPEYYRKFVHRDVPFPESSEKAVEKYIKKRVKEHFDVQKKGITFVSQLNDSHQDMLVKLCMAFNLSPRQVDELFRMLSHFLSSQEDKKVRDFYPILAAMLYSAIHLYDESICKKITKGIFEYSELLELFEKIRMPDIHDRWFEQTTICITSIGEKKYQSNVDYYIKKFHADIKKDSNDYKYLVNEIGRKKYQYIIRNESILQSVGKRIDSCMKFFDE